MKSLLKGLGVDTKTGVEKGMSILAAAWNTATDAAKTATDATKSAANVALSMTPDLAQIGKDSAEKILKKGTSALPKSIPLSSESITQLNFFSDLYQEIKDQRFNSVEDLVEYIIKDYYTDEMDKIFPRDVFVDMLVNPGNIPFIIIREMVLFINACLT